MTIRPIVATAVVGAALLASTASAQAPASFMVVSPVYSQLVAFSIPSNFVAGAERNDGTTYTREAVPKGETVDKWSELITVTGAKGLASQPNSSAEKFGGLIASGFKQACPDSFDVKVLGAAKTPDSETFAAVVGCGRFDKAASRSETTLVIAIKGLADIYTVQWSERGKPADKADVGNAKWLERLQKLAPLRVCAIVPGEAPPYPSCVGKN